MSGAGPSRRTGQRPAGQHQATRADQVQRTRADQVRATAKGGPATEAGGPATATGGREPDAERIATAVLGQPDVRALSAGPSGTVATYLPGRRVVGVVIQPDGAASSVEVHVVGRYGPTMAEIAQEVRAAVVDVAGDRPVTVVIDDLSTEPTPAGKARPASTHRE